MLIDFNYYKNNAESAQDILGAKYLLKSNVPYIIYKSSVLRDEKFAIITEEFGPKIRFAMSYDTNGNVAFMSETERDIWFKFLDYQDGSTFFTHDDGLAVEAIDDCFIAALKNETRKDDMCRSESYIKLMFDTISN